MNRTHSTHSTAILAASLAASCSFLLAQGPLTPPGAPAPTMKTLDQIEARTPISSAPFTINTAGSYYLTSNLTVAAGDAITISADHVTLDLNGFTIASTHATGSGTAVLINGARKNVTVKNGNIRGATTYAAGVFTPGGFLDGVFNGVFASANVRISDLNIHGMASDGIRFSFSVGSSEATTYAVERCQVTICAGFGIVAGLVRDCGADTTGFSAITADIAIQCSGETVGTGIGADGVTGSFSVENCRGISVVGDGVSGSNVSNSRGSSSSGIGVTGRNVSNCRGNSSSGTGVSGSNVSNCSGESDTGTGLSASNASNCRGSTSLGPAGIDANPGTASFCRGTHDTGGIAITATNAVACTVQAGTVTATTKSLGTP